MKGPKLGGENPSLILDIDKTLVHTHTHHGVITLKLMHRNVYFQRTVLIMDYVLGIIKWWGRGGV